MKKIKNARLIKLKIIMLQQKFLTLIIYVSEEKQIKGEKGYERIMEQILTV